MDLGGNESVAWKGGYTFRCQGEQGEWGDEIQEREEGEDGKGERNLLGKEGGFDGLTLRV